MWSSSWVLIRWGLDDEGLEPVTFAGLRYGIAALLLLVALLGQRRGRRAFGTLEGRDWLRLAALGLIFYTLTQGAQFVAIDHQPAATTSLFLSMTPLLVVAVSMFTLGERPMRRQVIGTMLVVAGAGLYLSGDLGITQIGMIAALVALFSNGAGSILGRAVNRSGDLSPLLVTALSMTLGAIALVIGGVAAEGVPTLSGRAWLIIIWLAAVNTALAFTLWNWSLQSLTATESAAINNMMLIQIALLAWWFLGETPSLLDWLGIGLVSIGVLLAQRLSGRHPVGSIDY